MFRMRPMGLRLLGGSLLLVGLIALAAVLGPHTRVSAATIVTVNSTANTDDGACTGSPNSGLGNCTLREAINVVNAGLADTIKFHIPVFSEATPGVINLEAGLGQLPVITGEVTIDARGAGVIIDGDGNANGIYCEAAGLAPGGVACSDGLEVHASLNAFAFSLLGGGSSHFVIQHIADPLVGGSFGDGDGVFLCGDPTGNVCNTRSFGIVVIDGVDIRHIGDALPTVAANGDVVNGIDIKATNLDNVSITHNEITAFDRAVSMFADAGAPITNCPNGCFHNNTVLVDSNILNSSGDLGVSLHFDGDLGNLKSHTLNASVTNNTFTSDRGVGVDFDGNVKTSAINVDVSHNGNITGFSSNGVNVDIGTDTGDPCPVNPAVLCEARNSNVTTTVHVDSNGTITGADGVHVNVQICCGHSHSSSTVTVNHNNDITGTASGVTVQSSVCCGSLNTSTVETKSNRHIKGIGSDGVNLDSEAVDDGVTGTGDNNASTITLSDNTSIQGAGGDGAAVHSHSGNGADTSTPAGEADDSTSLVTISGNGPITGTDFGIGFTSEVTSYTGPADGNTAGIDITHNGEISGDNDQAIKGDATAMQMDFGPSGDDGDPGNQPGNNNTARINISDNADILTNSSGADSICAGAQAQPAGLACSSADEAIQVVSHAGSNSGVANDNTASLIVNHNGNITGAAETAVNAEVFAMSAIDGSSGNNTSTIEVTNNANIRGGGLGDGVAVNALAGSLCSDIADLSFHSGSCDWHSDHNTSTVKVNHNANITGHDGEAVDIDSDAGLVADIACCGSADADHNNATIEVIGNHDITSTFSTGLDADPTTIGHTAGSVDNHNTLTITDNNKILGGGGDGINIDIHTCCDPANTNTMTINHNGDIIGKTGNGIVVPGICCSVNLFTVQNNTGVITGNDGDGIHYEVQTGLTTGDCNDNDCNSNGFPDAIEDSVNALNISGNQIVNSTDSGIDICCGAFDGTMVGRPSIPKSIITNNQINNNGGDGIMIDTSQGINIGPNNTISGNGLAVDPTNGGFDVHAGVQIVNEFSDTCSISLGTATPTPILCTAAGIFLTSNGNTITQNSIFDNSNAFSSTLGIDLNPTGDAVPGDPRVGCISKGNPINPNDCLQAPVILLIAADGKIGGTTCAGCNVEIFLADATPPDQPLAVAAIQHGEGKTYLASGHADDAGNFSVHLPCGQGGGDLTATATDKTKNTSEFSENRPFLGTPSCATATPTRTNTPAVTPTFTAAPPTPTRTNTPVPPSPTATRTPAKACGDVNDDGHVNSIDAQLILQLKVAFITTLPNLPSADVNHDGQITAVDSQLILQFEVGLITASQLHCA